VRSNHKNRFSI